MNVSPQSTIEACAKTCKSRSSMFIFGTNDFTGGDASKERCDDTGCKCYCELVATEDGTCTQIPHSGYRLYKFPSK